MFRAFRLMLWMLPALPVALFALACSSQEDEAPDTAGEPAAERAAEPAGDASSRGAADALSGAAGDAASAVADAADRAAKQVVAVAVGAAEPIVIPSPPLRGNDQLLGALRLREPNKTLDRMGVWISDIQPGMTADALRGMATMYGIDFTQMSPGENLGSFVYVPAEGQMMGAPPPIVALLPMPALPEQLKQRMPVQEVPMGAHTLVGMDPNAITKARGDEGMLTSMIQAASYADMEISVNLDQVWEIYGPMISNQMQQVRQQVQNMPPSAMGATSADQLQRVLGAETQAVEDLMAQMDNAMLGLDFEPEAVELSLIGEARAGTGLARALNVPPTDPADLMGHLPSDRAMVIQQSIEDPREFMEVYTRYMNMALPEGSDATAAMNALIEDWEKVGAATFATAFGTQADGAMAVDYLIKAEDPDALMDFITSKISEINEGPLHDLYAQSGLNMTAETLPERSLNGQTVHAFKFDIAPGEQQPAGMPMGDPEMINRIIGEGRFELVRSGDLVAMTMNHPVDELARAARTSAPPSEAREDFPAGGVFYGAINVPAYLRMIADWVPEAQMELPEFDTSLPAVTMAGFHQQGKAYYRMQVPRTLVSTVVRKMQEFQQQQMMQEFEQGPQMDGSDGGSMNGGGY